MQTGRGGRDGLAPSNTLRVGAGVLRGLLMRSLPGGTVWLGGDYLYPCYIPPPGIALRSLLPEIPQAAAAPLFNPTEHPRFLTRVHQRYCYDVPETHLTSQPALRLLLFFLPFPFLSVMCVDCVNLRKRLAGKEWRKGRGWRENPEKERTLQGFSLEKGWGRFLFPWG